MRMLNSHVTVHRWICLLVMVLSFVQPAEVKSKTLLTLPARMMEGVLDNGMRYILMPGETSSHNLEMRLVMRVGSLQETQRQRGCAHFLEHLAFEGTKHFPNRTMIQAFEAQGMKYGRDINAFTGFDRTIYSLSLPITSAQQRSEILQLALHSASDWLGAIDISKSHVENEKGTIIEELRSYTLSDDFYALKIGTGRYSKRMPLGSEQEIKAVTPKALLQYYNKWYKPHNATIIIVGDVDVKEAKHLISTTLGHLPYTNKQTPPPTYPLTYSKGINYMVLTDSLQTTQKIDWIIPHVMPFTTNLHNMLERKRMAIVCSLLNNRLKESGTRCEVYDSWYLANKNHFTFSFSSTHNSTLLQSIRAASAECRRIVKQGICSIELQHLIKKQQEKIIIEKKDKTATEICDDLIDYVIFGERRIYSNQEANQLKVLLSKTTSKDIVKRLSFLLKQMRKSSLIAYNSHSDNSLSKQAIIQAWQQGQRQNMERYTFHPLHPSSPSAAIQRPEWDLKTYKIAKGAITKQNYHEKLGVTDIKLSNGIRLLLKPTNTADSTIYSAWIGRGGMADLTTLQQKRYYDAIAYVDLGGIQGLPNDTLSDIMMQKSLSMALGVDQYWHQLLASGPVCNSSSLFRLIREKIMHPGLDYPLFENLKQSEIANNGKETLLQRMMKRDINRLIDICIDSLVGNGRDKTFLMNKTDWQQLNLDTLATYYKRTFGDLRNTTIILTGGFDLTKMIPQAVAIFSEMPQQDAMPLDNRPISLPHNEVRKVFIDNDSHQKGTLYMVLPFNYHPGLRTSLCMKLMRDLLQECVIDILREKLHIVYSPYVDLFYDGYPQQRAYLQLTIDAEKNNLEKVEQTLCNIVTQFRDTAVSTANLDKMKRSFLVAKQQALSNDTPIEWKNALTLLIKNDESIADFNHYESILQQITAQEIQQMFKQHIKLNKRIVLINTDETNK
ncbi:pitrilysin family protein [Hoylesella buccalis]|uniref:M16 family metallopeptidase n=1 Tax=Hoylesella buccalis TaxID=28127 RepID=UPI000AEF5939|nr:M16 family metallopeptidase [Hoylesella buccalis]